MANEKTLKKITLHPISNGQQDDSVDLLSKTSVNNILSGTVDAVDPDGDPTTFDAGFTKELKYDSIQKEIIIPAEIVDGQEYTLPTQYDLSKIDMPEDDTLIYLDNENRFLVGTFKSGSFKVIHVDLDGVQPYYSTESNQWMINDSEDVQSQEPVAVSIVPYTDPITFTYDETCLNTEYKDLFALILGLEPTIEHITVERTAEEKNADIKNWEYNRETHTEVIPALTTGTEYKFNFNVDSYMDLLVPQLQVLDYGSTDFNDTHINSCPCVYNTIHLETYNGAYYTFFFDLLDETVHGYWADASGTGAHKYTPEELENITFKYYAAGLQTYSGTIVTSEDIIKTIFTNLDGSAITELVDETTYKFNPNVAEYKELFIDLDRNGSYVYNYSMPDSTFKNIQIWTYNYYTTPFFFNNGNAYYLIPRIDDEYPGTWGSTSSYWDNSHHVYTPEELEDLEDITFVFDRDKIDGSGTLHVMPVVGRVDNEEVTSESLLHRLLLNLDDTPIADDQEEEVTIITTMDQKMNEPLENKLYGKTAKTIEVPGDFEDDTEYSFKTDMQFSNSDAGLILSVESGTHLYFDEDSSIDITYNLENGQYYLFCDIDGSEYYYDIADKNSEDFFINSWFDGNIPDPIYIYLNCINPETEDFLKRLFNIPTTTETIYEDKTLAEKVEDLPNWKYSGKIGVFDIPKWEAFVPYEGTYNYKIYWESTPNSVIRVGYDCETDYLGTDNYAVYIDHSDYSTESRVQYCIYRKDYEGLKGNTWYLLEMPKEPVALDAAPDFILDPDKYLDPNYTDLFNAIYGDSFLTLKDKIDSVDNAILKDKTYDNITKQISIPDDFIDGNYYDFKANMNFSDSDSEMLDTAWNASSGDLTAYYPVYDEGENGSNILVTFVSGRSESYVYIDYYDAYNDNSYRYDLATWVDGEYIYTNTWENKPYDIQINTNAIVNSNWLNRIVENTTHQGTETIAQTLEEKFAEVEAKINSHTDTGVLKDKIYDYTIELENGQEYSLATDMEPFFDRFGTDGYTIIYGSTGSSGGGDMPIYVGNSVESPTSVMSNDGNGTRGGGMALEPALPTDPVSPGGLGEIYITRITLVNTYTPPKEKELLAADSGTKGGTELKGVDSVGLGETYVEVCDNFYNYYYYYKGADSWTNDNGDSVTVANLPKFKLDTTLVQDFDMLKFVLQTIPQTLEAKLSEGIANWNYEQGKINSFPSYAPLFNVMSVLQTNSSIIGQAGLFNDQDGTRIYQDDTTVIEWSCDNSNYTLNIYYGILDEAESLVYEINCNISMSNNTETWTGTAIPSTGGGGIIVSPATIYSQEELPFIEYYSPANIESGYEQVVPLLLTEIYAKGEPTTLAQKIADIKNWEYANIPTTYKFNKTVDWSQLPSAGEISSDIDIYYDDTTSWYTTLVLKDDTINYLLYKPQYLQALSYPQYRNYRLDYTDADTGSTAEAGKWYYVEHVKTGQYSYGDKFIEVTPIEDFNSLYIVNPELFKVIVDSAEAQEYTVADMVEGPLKDKTYDNVLQEKLVDNAEYNLKAELNTGDGNKLTAMSENCVDPVANVGEYDTGMASPWTSFMLDGYLIATGANNSWYYLDETTTWQKIKNIEIINGSSAITDSNKRIASQGTFTYNNKTYLAWPTAWPNNTFNQYVIPCIDNYTTKMIYEIEFDPSDKTITLTGHKLSFNATPTDDYLYGNKFFEFNGALLYADRGYNNYIYEIDLENDTATQGIYNKFKCKYGSGTTITNIVEEETLGSFNGRHIITPINGVDFTSWHGADNNGTSTFFKIRHATAAEVAAYPDLNLSETTSVLYDLINPSNPTCGINSTVQSTSAVTVRGYIASGRFIYTHNGTNYLGSLYYYYNNGTTKYFAYKFNESTNTWSTVTLNRPTGISNSSFLSGDKFIYDDVSQNTYLVDDYKNIYRVTGLENNQINFEKVELHGAGYPYANPAPEDGEVAQIECSYSADANSYIDTLYIKDDDEIVPIAYCDGSDYWKDIDTDQQIDVSDYTIYNTRKFFDIHVDSSLIELVANLETDVPVTLGEVLDNQLITFNATITANAWDTTSDQTLAALYPYQAVIETKYLLNGIKCEVEFAISEIISDNYAGFFNYDDELGTLTIYAKTIPADSITIKVIRWLGTKVEDIVVDAN